MAPVFVRTCGFESRPSPQLKESKLIKEINLKEEHLSDWDKFKKILKTFEFEDQKTKIYMSEQFGSSSFGYYPIALYLFKIDKTKKKKYKGIKGLYHYFKDMCDKSSKGGIRDDVVIAIDPPNCFDDSKHNRISINDNLLLDFLKEKLDLEKFEKDIKLYYKK